jgi:hypothetical protein
MAASCIAFTVYFFLSFAAVVRIECPRDIVQVADTRTTKASVAWDKDDFSIHSTHPIK